MKMSTTTMVLVAFAIIGGALFLNSINNSSKSMDDGSAEKSMIIKDAETEKVMDQEQKESMNIVETAVTAGNLIP